MNAVRTALGSLVESRFRRFILFTFVLLTVGALLWLAASRYYTAFVAAASNGLLWFLGQARLGTFAAEGDTIQVHHQAQGVTSPIEVAGFYAFFNLVVLLALMLATPGVELRQRIGLVLLGTGVMVVVHLSTVYLNLRMTYMFSRQLAFPSRSTVLLIRAGQILTGAVGEQLFPLLIWGMLTLRYWTVGSSR
jgi:hypothetical protein